MGKNRVERDPICFRCGNPVWVSGDWNRLPDGEVCPACRNRMLDLLPAPLPQDRSRLHAEQPPSDAEFLPEEPPDGPARA